MRLTALVLWCVMLVSSVRLPETEPPTVLVEWPEECAYGWAVRWSYNGLTTLSQHDTPEGARRLYAVLAGRMRGGTR